MKTMKVALLATAALAAVSVSARADDAASIKAQLEALNARIAQLEAAPAVPTGYSLLTMTEVAPLTLTGEKAADVSNTKSHRISVLPTADMPAATTIDWDLEVRARISYFGYNDDTFLGSPVDDGVEVQARGRIRVKASTDTSVGTVGVDLRVQGASEFGDGADVVMNIAWGWWQMTPEWTLGGGYTGTLSDPGHGQDGWISHGNTMWLASGVPADQEQFRLTYASGPLTWAIALEDNDLIGVGSTQLAVASRIDYAGDAFSASLSGYYGPRHATAVVSGKDVWQVGAGADFTLGDMATLSISGAVGHANTDFDYVRLTGFAGFDLTEATSFEISAAHSWNDDGVNDVTLINGGIYWKPVDQLKMGLQADHTIVHGGGDRTTVSFVTWFSY